MPSNVGWSRHCPVAKNNKGPLLLASLPHGIRFPKLFYYSDRIFICLLLSAGRSTFPLQRTTKADSGSHPCLTGYGPPPPPNCSTKAIGYPFCLLMSAGRSTFLLQRTTSPNWLAYPYPTTSAQTILSPISHIRAMQEFTPRMHVALVLPCLNSTPLRFASKWNTATARSRSFHRLPSLQMIYNDGARLPMYLHTHVA